MRVKVRNTWYECEPGQPIQVELEAQDKINIISMDPQAKRYALFSDEDKSTQAEKFAWMNEGAR